MLSPHPTPHARVAAAAALLAALLLTLVSSPAPAAAKARACKPGEAKVRVAVKKKQRARLTCRALDALPPAADPAAALERAAVSPGELRAALPKRLRKRYPLALLQRVDRAVAFPAPRARAAAVPVIARAAAAGDCSKPATPSGSGDSSRDVEGGKVTTSGGSWGEPGGATWGTTATVKGEVKGKTAVASQTQTTKTCVSWDTCPDADGNVTGTFELALDIVTEGTTQDGMHAVVRVTARNTAKLTGHVGADGRVTTFDWDAEGTIFGRGEVRQNGKLVKAKAGPSVRVTSRQTGADPRNRGRAPGRPQVGGWGLDGSVLDGSLEGAIDGARSLVAAQLNMLPGAAADGLLGAEKVWYDQAACLDVAFDPQPAQVKPNDKVPVAVKVRAKDGAEVEATYDAQPVDGAVGPPTGTTPATITWTAPGKLDDGTFETFRVTAVSKRGRALGTHTARAEKGHWWKVTYQGAGEYRRHEPRSTPYPQLTSEIHFRYRMVSMPARLPYDDGNPGMSLRTSSETAEVSGDTHATRTDGGGTDTCDSALDGTNVTGWIEARGGDGGFHLDVVPFPWLKPASQSCPFDDMLHWTTSTTEGMTVALHVSQAELDTKDRIERHVSSGGPLSSDCWGGTANGDWPCTQNVTWEGTVVLERVAAPAGERP